MDGHPRQNPAYRPATESPRKCGGFLFAPHVPLPGVDTNHPGAWIFSQKTVDGSGHIVPQFTIGSVCPPSKGSTLASLDRCVRTHGFLNTDVFQPAGRFWLFQGIEAALFTGLAIALLAVAFWWVRRRIA